MLHVRSLELVLITEDLYLLMCIMEKAMATHSSILAWRIPGVEEPGGLPSVGSHRVGHDLAACVSPCLCLPPAPWQTPFLHSLFLWSWFWSFVCFDSTCKWHHTVFVFLCLAYFTCRNGLQVYSCCYKKQDFLFFFFDWVMFYRVYIYACPLSYSAVSYSLWPHGL